MQIKIFLRDNTDELLTGEVVWNPRKIGLEVTSRGHLILPTTQQDQLYLSH